MVSIKYQLLGLGMILFASCPYIIGITTDAPQYMFAGVIIQIIGFILVIIGFNKKET